VYENRKTLLRYS